jgi:uncharacterized protein YmfQ (DUF2313 family)
MNYHEILKSLLPKGLFWEGRQFLNMIDGIACVFNRISNDIDAIYDECLPKSAKILIDDWERLFKINNSHKTLRERREIVAAKMCASGGNTEDYFLSIIKNFDKNAIIQKNNPNLYFFAGKSRAGETIGRRLIPRYTVIFVFSIAENEDCKKTLEKCKPAHLEFIYLFNKKVNKFL